MSDKDKSKPSKSVMGNLPSTRPTRMARRRDGDATGTPAEAPAQTASKTARAKPRPKPKTAAKPKAATRPKTARPKAEAATSKPRAVRSGSPSLDAAKKPRAKRREPAPAPPKGSELVTTAVQATGELAKIGLTLGSQALKRAARRLPKR
jgi:hypothetical protein